MGAEVLNVTLTDWPRLRLRLRIWKLEAEAAAIVPLVRPAKLVVSIEKPAGAWSCSEPMLSDAPLLGSFQSFSVSVGSDPPGSDVLVEDAGMLVQSGAPEYCRHASNSLFPEAGPLAAPTWASTTAATAAPIAATSHLTRNCRIPHSSPVTAGHGHTPTGGGAVPL